MEWCTQTRTIAHITLLLDCLAMVHSTHIVSKDMNAILPYYYLDYSKIYFKDITDIIANCASTHWADRKDGLIGLQCFFRDGRSQRLSFDWWVWYNFNVCSKPIQAYTILMLAYFVGCFLVQSYGALRTYSQRCSWTRTQRSCPSIEFSKAGNRF